MLLGISPLISPELLAVLHRMGHGDEIVLADAHFPGDTFGKRVLRADGLKIYWMRSCPFLFWTVMSKVRWL
jgi:L-fucose mutarotase